LILVKFIFQIEFQKNIFVSRFVTELLNNFAKHLTLYKEILIVDIKNTLYPPKALQTE
jgi:hypothetical protein